MPQTERKPVIVTLDGSRPMDDVATDLAAKGFEVGARLEAIHNLTGWMPSGADLGEFKISGVLDVSHDHPVDIGPPGSTNTW